MLSVNTWVEQRLSKREGCYMNIKKCHGLNICLKGEVAMKKRDVRQLLSKKGRML